MARVQGIREQVHLPLYDSIKVDPGKQLHEVESSSTLKFFVDVQGKTKLETNLQSASLLPHYNTFEARAMRVVISDQPPVFSEKEIVDTDLPVTDEEGRRIDKNGNVDGVDPAFVATDKVTADIKIGLDVLIELIRLARASEDGFADLSPDEEGVTAKAVTSVLTDVQLDNVLAAGGMISFTQFYWESYLDVLTKEEQPLEEQIESNNGSGSIVGKLIYNTVTSLYVGEKLMIQMPTYFFPAGAGPFSGTGRFTTHGESSPLATFRFATPVYVDRLQNFRVEIEIPDTEVLEEIKRLYGPLHIWVILDGFMVRDVQ